MCVLFFDPADKEYTLRGELEDMNGLCALIREMENEGMENVDYVLSCHPIDSFLHNTVTVTSFSLG